MPSIEMGSLTVLTTTVGGESQPAFEDFRFIKPPLLMSKAWRNGGTSDYGVFNQRSNRNLHHPRNHAGTNDDGAFIAENEVTDIYTRHKILLEQATTEIFVALTTELQSRRTEGIRTPDLRLGMEVTVIYAKHGILY